MTESTTYSSGRKGETPEFRCLHFNDVYHIEAGDREPVGGAARFVNLVNHYRDGDEFKGQPGMLTFFSGDAFNPSLESTVSKGKHMVPILNAIKTDVATAGNHDFDFSAQNFQYLAKMCQFPWLLGNVLDPALGMEPMGGCKKTVILTTSNGLKLGIIGLAEREWLETVNSIAPDIVYKSASKTAMELLPPLREECDMIICLAHQREPNDEKLARLTDAGLIDIILGGHDHYYNHQIVNGCHILRSGSDFQQLSYIEAWRKKDGSKGWDFEITRRDVTKDVPEDESTAKLIEDLTAGLKSKMEQPIGFTSVPLDARFTTVRTREANLSNFVCDLMRFYYDADCALMAAGTIRGDQIYGPGIFRLKDIMNCFPFTDPVVVIKVTGKALWDALENSVSQVPALEGRFPCVSNIYFEYNKKAPAGSRIRTVRVGHMELEMEKQYVLSTRGYMAKGKDGFTSLTEEAGCETIIDDEAGVLISTILRTYFLSLKVIGRWKRGKHAMSSFDSLKRVQTQKGELKEPSSPIEHREGEHSFPSSVQEDYENAQDSSEDSSDEGIDSGTEMKTEESTKKAIIAKMVGRKWERLALNRGLESEKDNPGPEFAPSWCKGIAPQLEGRIKEVDT